MQVCMVWDVCVLVHSWSADGSDCDGDDDDDHDDDLADNDYDDSQSSVMSVCILIYDCCCLCAGDYTTSSELQ